MQKIVVKDYNPKWAEDFQAFKTYYERLLTGIDCDIQHVGSTSVEGLAAKPIIDMDIIAFSEMGKREIICRLETVGYIHQGDLGIKGREAFARTSGKVPCSEPDRDWPDHHLYCCMKGIESLENHLKLRDYLRENPEAVKEYSELKKLLAGKYIDDIESYVEDKTDFIVKILSLSGMKTDILTDISDQNKKKR